MLRAMRALAAAWLTLVGSCLAMPPGPVRAAVAIPAPATPVAARANPALDIRDRHDRPAVRRPPRRRVAVRFSCAEALDDGTLVDFGQTKELASLARQLTWSEVEAPPQLSPRDVRVFCGPDVNGDGDRDALARISFENPEGSASEIDGGLIVYTLLVSRHAAGAWRVLAPVAAEVTGDRDVRQSLAFVRLGAGKWAIEIERSSFASDTGCRITGYEVLAWRAGGLRTMEAGDRSPGCVPCGCDQQ